MSVSEMIFLAAAIYAPEERVGLSPNAEQFRNT